MNLNTVKFLWHNVGMTTYHHGDLQQSLVSQASQEIALGGSQSISLRHVASEVGVSASAAYHHFADKQALLDAVAHDVIERLGIAMGQALARIPGDDNSSAIARFEALGQVYLTFAQENPNLFLHAFGPNCTHDQPGDSVAFDELVAVLDDLDSRGLVRPGIRVGLENVVWSSVHGLSMLTLTGLVDSNSHQEYLSSIRRLVLT